MGHKCMGEKWSNVLILSVLLTIPMVMCAMEQKKEIRTDGINLIRAFQRAPRNIVDYLMKKGPYIDIADRHGNTDLILKSKGGKKEVVDSLIKGGANVNAVAKSGDIALIWASIRGHKEVVDSLIKEGANVNAVSNNGTTALMRASYKGHKEIVDSLIEAGADINAIDNNGWTALMWASQWSYKEVVENLIKGGANPYIKNNEGKNSLDIAKNDDEELKKHIIKKRNEYVIKKYKEYLIDGKNRMEALSALLQKEYDWYKPYGDEDKGEQDEHSLQEVKQSYPFPKDIAGVIARIRYDISDDEWAQMRRLENEQQLLQ